MVVEEMETHMVPTMGAIKIKIREYVVVDLVVLVMAVVEAKTMSNVNFAQRSIMLLLCVTL